MNTNLLYFLLIVFVILWFLSFLYKFLTAAYRTSAGKATSNSPFDAAFVSLGRMKRKTNEVKYIEKRIDSSFLEKILFPLNKKIHYVKFYIVNLLKVYKRTRKVLIRKERIRQTLARIRWEKRKAELWKAASKYATIFGIALIIIFLINYNINSIKLWIFMNFGGVIFSTLR